MNIFLSYTHQDSSVAKEVINSLETAGHFVWDHRIEIKVGDSIVQKVNEAIENSDVAIFLMSKKSTTTQNWSYEWSQAVSSQGRGKLSQIIPVLLEKDVPMPFFLQNVRYLDATDPKTRMPRINDLISTLDISKFKQDQQLDYDLEKKRLIIEHAEIAFQKILLKRESHLRSLRISNIMLASIGFVTISMMIFAFFKAIPGSYDGLGWLVGLTTGIILASVVGFYIWTVREKTLKRENKRQIEVANEIMDKIFDTYKTVRK